MPEPTDQRAAERFPVNTETCCSFLSPVVADFGPAKIRNLSMEGIGLLVSRRIEPGTLLAVTLSNPARAFAKTVLVRVVHTTPQPGGCLVGGTFSTPLTYQELTTLVL
jgi:PilZ domain